MITKDSRFNFRQIYKFLEEVRSLRFSEAPNYYLLKQLLEEYNPDQDIDDDEELGLIQRNRGKQVAVEITTKKQVFIH